MFLLLIRTGRVQSEIPYAAVFINDWSDQQIASYSS